MKNGHFVEGVSNVVNFTAAWRAIEGRNALEASLLLAIGEPGNGKTRTLQWFAMQLEKQGRKVGFVRAKAIWTPNRMLKDIAVSLGIDPRQRMEDLLESICQIMAAHNGVLIVDEANHAMRDIRTIETIRDITDTTFCSAILGAHDQLDRVLRRHPQIHSRVGTTIEFGRATAEDVQTICSELSAVSIANDLAHKVLEETQGSFRLIKGAIGRIEAFGKSGREAITLDMWKNRPLLATPRASLALVKEAARG